MANRKIETIANSLEEMAAWSDCCRFWQGRMQETMLLWQKLFISTEPPATFLFFIGIKRTRPITVEDLDKYFFKQNARVEIHYVLFFDARRPNGMYDS